VLDDIAKSVSERIGDAEYGSIHIDEYCNFDAIISILKNTPKTQGMTGIWETWHSKFCRRCPI